MTIEETIKELEKDPERVVTCREIVDVLKSIHDNETNLLKCVIALTVAVKAHEVQLEDRLKVLRTELVPHLAQ